MHQVVAAQKRKPQGTDDPEDESSYEVCLRADFPEKRAAQGSHCYNNVPDQIIQPEHARLTVVRCQVHDQGFAGWLAELLEPAEDKCHHQPLEGAAELEDEGEKSKKDEGNEDKGLLSAPVRQEGHRDINQYRRGHFD